MKRGHDYCGQMGRFVCKAYRGRNPKAPFRKDSRIVYGTVRGINHRGLKKRKDR